MDFFRVEFREREFALNFFMISSFYVFMLVNWKKRTWEIYDLMALYVLVGKKCLLSLLLLLQHKGNQEN